MATLHKQYQGEHQVNVITLSDRELEIIRGSLTIAIMETDIEETKEAEKLREDLG